MHFVNKRVDGIMVSIEASHGSLPWIRVRFPVDAMQWPRDTLEFLIFFVFSLFSGCSAPISCHGGAGAAGIGACMSSFFIKDLPGYTAALRCRPQLRMRAACMSYSHSIRQLVSRTAASQWRSCSGPNGSADRSGAASNACKAGMQPGPCGCQNESR